MISFVDLKKQYQAYKTDIDKQVQTVIENASYIMGPEVTECEQKLAQFCDAKHCITVSSGTMSLEIALRALKIGPGDEVITVPFTWISSAEVIRLVGATPIFVDIEASTFNMDAQQLESVITPRTKAVIPVSLFGQMPDLESINAIAEKHGLTVIEDAAQSFGATRNGTASCNASHIGSTSFFPAKPLGCYGDGGALFTNNDVLAEKILTIRTHGGVRRHHHTTIGTNGRFDTLQAAVLLAKLRYFPQEVAERLRLGARYSSMLRDICVVPEVAPGNSHVYSQYTIRTPNRDSIAEKLRHLGVPTAVYYPKCLHEQPAFRDLGYSWGDFPESETASRDVLSLPIHPFLTDVEQETVVVSVRTCLEG